MPFHAFEEISAAARHLLEEAPSPARVMEALARIGEALGVDRVYVFENGRTEVGRRVMSQRFEWSSGATASQVDNPELQGVPYAEFVPLWEELFPRGGIFCGLPREMDSPVRELLERQGIRSMLVCPILVDGVWWGFVGFDDCQRERSWPTAEVAGLRLLARALGRAVPERCLS